MNVACILISSGHSRFSDIDSSKSLPSCEIEAVIQLLCVRDNCSFYLFCSFCIGYLVYECYNRYKCVHLHYFQFLLGRHEVSQE